MTTNNLITTAKAYRQEVAALIRQGGRISQDQLQRITPDTGEGLDAAKRELLRRLRAVHAMN